MKNIQILTSFSPISQINNVPAASSDLLSLNSAPAPTNNGSAAPGGSMGLLVDVLGDLGGESSTDVGGTSGGLPSLTNNTIGGGASFSSGGSGSQTQDHFDK